MSDDYVSISGQLKVIRPKAILLEPQGEDAVWVPRSLIHGADERDLDELAEDQEITIRVREWFCEKENLI